MKKLEKTLTLGKLSAIEWKKGFQDLLNTGMCKILIEKYFCLVQQSPKFKRINKQLNDLKTRPFC